MISLLNKFKIGELYYTYSLKLKNNSYFLTENKILITKIEPLMGILNPTNESDNEICLTPEYLNSVNASTKKELAIFNTINQKIKTEHNRLNELKAMEQKIKNNISKLKENDIFLKFKKNNPELFI